MYLASYGSRVGATLIDGAIEGLPVLVGYVLLGVLGSGPGGYERDDTRLMLGFAAAVIGWLCSFGIVLGNRVFRQGRTGQSIGKRICGIAVIMPGTRLPTGPGMSFVRQLGHLVDAWLIIGYLWPLWDPRRRTFADMMTGTVVVKVR